MNKIKKYNCVYRKNRIQTDSVFAMKCKISKNIRKIFNCQGKINTKYTQIIGLSSDAFYKYLLQTFKNTYGRDYNPMLDNVHIDHIKALKQAKTINDVIEYNHYTNLQLLLAEDNMKKNIQESF